MVDLKLAQDQLTQLGRPAGRPAPGRGRHRRFQRVHSAEQTILTRLAQLDERLKAIETKLDASPGAEEGPRAGEGKSVTDRGARGRRLPERGITMNIKGKSAVITGAGSGIGQAVAIELAERGIGAVGLVDRSDSVIKVARIINDRMDRPVAEAIIGDVTDVAFRQKAYDLMCSKYGRRRSASPRRASPATSSASRWTSRPARRRSTRSRTSAWSWRSTSSPPSTGRSRWSPGSPRSGSRRARAGGPPRRGSRGR